MLFPDRRFSPLLDGLADWYRKLSWLALLIALLMLGNAEFGFPPDKNPWKPKSPPAVLRTRYLLAFAIGLPGATWAVVRAIRRHQKTPWGDWD
jgi:hypothetical protein